MCPAQPHPQGQGTAMAIFLAGLEGERLALPEPRVGKVRRLGKQLGGPGFSGRGIKAKLAVSEHCTRVVWARAPRGGPGTPHRPSGVQVTSRGCDSSGLWTASFIYFCAEP